MIEFEEKFLKDLAPFYEIYAIIGRLCASFLFSTSINIREA